MLGNLRIDVWVNWTFYHRKAVCGRTISTQFSEYSCLMGHASNALTGWFKCLVPALSPPHCVVVSLRSERFLWGFVSFSLDHAYIGTRAKEKEVWGGKRRAMKHLPMNATILKNPVRPRTRFWFALHGFIDWHPWIKVFSIVYLRLSYWKRIR